MQILGGCLLVGTVASAAPADPVLDTLGAELTRNFDAWQSVEDPPYYLSARLVDVDERWVTAEHGALVGNGSDTERVLTVGARVGSPDLDNTHPMRDEAWFRFGDYSVARLPLDGPPGALAVPLWRLIDGAVDDARERIVMVRANRSVRAEEADRSPDFGAEDPVVDVLPEAAVSIDDAAWAEVTRELSARMARVEGIEVAIAQLKSSRETSRFVDTAGTRIRQPRVRVRIAVWATATTEDGAEVDVYRWRDVHDPTHLPPVDELRDWADAVAADVAALRVAPELPPYRGPVLLRGKAAGVFVHEVIGHRVEGNRQKDEEEGQTFKDMVGERVLPEGFHIVDDPRIQRLAGEDLNGFYAYDDEGVPAREAVIVEDGIFRGFLLNRSPIAGFEKSNGHGRASHGSTPMARMANTILRVDDPLSEAELRAALLALVKDQGLEYGVIIDEIGGGFTMTGRVYPNAFNVRASTAWRVYADGRPDERIRGIDLIGTPLVALSQVVAAGGETQVFNGVCGAASGWVPNAAVAPSVLLDRMELQKKEKRAQRPPLLAPPASPPGEGA